MRWWVDIWDLRERGDSLAVMRFLTGIVFIGDLLWGGAAGVVPLLWAPAEAGGLPDVLGRPGLPWTYQLLPATAASAYLIWGLAVGFGAMMTVGLFGRIAVLGTLLCSAQLALIHPNADRGIELVVRQVMFILVFSECTAAWSVDAWRRTKSWKGDGRLVAAWPRHLLILQLIVIYWMAGIQKFATPWWPAGDFSALYYVLENPIYARFDVDWGGALFPLTQAASVGTLAFEWFGPPLLLLAYWGRFAAGREGREPGRAPGRFVRWFNRLRFRDVFVAVGFSLHIGIEVLMDLGSFAIAMLAVYPVFFHPDELAGMAGWVRGIRAPVQDA